MTSASTQMRPQTRLPLAVLALITLLVWTVPQPGMAATPEPAWKFTRTIDGWTATLNRIEKGFANQERTTETATEQRATLQALRDDANLARTAANEHVDETEKLLSALGAKPAEGATAEARDVAEKRAAYEAKLADFRGRAAQAQLIVRRVDTALSSLAEIEQNALLEELMVHQTVPISPDNLAAAPVAFWTYLARIRTTLQAGLVGAQDNPEAKPKSLIVLGVIALLSASAFASRQLLVRKFGRVSTIAAPSYTRRLIAASVEPLANGLLPAMIAAASWYGLNWAFVLDEGDFRQIIEGGLSALLIIIAAFALPHAALSPDQPNWRVAPIKAKHARYMTKRIAALGLLFGLDVFVGFTVTQADASWLTIYAATIATLEAALVLDLLRPVLWRPDANWHETETGDLTTQPPEQTTRTRIIQALRLTIAVLAIGSVIAGWSGYTALSAYLIGGLLGSAIVIGALFLLRALLAEWIGVLMHRRDVIDSLNLSDAGTETVSFWLIGFMQVTIFVSGALIVGEIWGLQLGEAGNILYNLATAMQIGGITISIADITSAILTLFIALALFRLAKRLLAGTILPQTKLDAGAQYSIATIFGYIGIIISVVMAATALGMEFQNLIIIAGALSVGIGFGLQNIANNFVSGLILLFERPVRVGDLIEINGTMGYVTHINVRRTEIETFQRSEVMIPNSELVSTSVTNWTHTDRKGRIDINVGVAYGSDTELVRKTLLAAVETVDKILTWPQPDVLFLDFGDSSLNFQLRCFTDDVTSRIGTASNLRFEIDRLFREHNIEIPFPQRVVHMAPGSTLPPGRADEGAGERPEAPAEEDGNN